MYPISNAVKALFEAEEKQVLRITGTDANGVAISITDANVMLDGFNIDRFSCNGNKLEIGTACASELTLKLDNRQGQYSGIVFEGAELFVEVGIGSPVNWIPCGYFTPDEQPRSLSTITIKALDRMTKLDVIQPYTPWTTQNGDVMTDSEGNILYFASYIGFPSTVEDIVKRVCLLCSIPFSQDLSGFPNYNYVVQSMPELEQEITMRNVIQWCAGIMGANAWIDWTGSLRFSWYGATTGYTTTTANRFSSDLFEDDITLTGVTYTNTQGVSIVSGTPEYALDMTGNYMAASGISTILPNIKNRINGFTYRPFTASVINAPYLWPMDMITFNKDGVDYTCAITNVNFGINGTTELAGKGETAQTNSGVAPSGVTKEQGFLIEEAAESVRKLDEDLDQEGIFNRLTDNGEMQGLILYNGKVYLNASYIQTGTMVADFIKGGILTLGGNNNVNGVMQVLDASGNVIGTWNNDGIMLNKGTIAGPSVTLGGNNNSDGVLNVKDANGNVIGMWNNDGLTLKKGSIEGPSITLGNSYNNDGTLIVKNYMGYTTGIWDNNGVQVLYPNGTLKFRADSDEFNVADVDTLHIEGEGEVILWDHEYGSMREKIKKTIGPHGETYSMYTREGELEYEWSIDYFHNGLIYNIDDLNIKSSDNNYMFRVTHLSSYDLATVNGTLDVYGKLEVYGDLLVTGTKPRLVTTDQYSKRYLYCYETPTPMFGDIGEGTIGEDGLCYISLDAVFAQTVVTQQYHVFLQRYGEGECWVRERKGAYFIVQGTPGLSFGWEIKAKQRDYDQLRLERADEPFTVPEQSYGADAAQYINEIKKERIPA